MKTKSIWLWVLLLVTAIFGCKYDDADLWNKVNSLDDRLTNIEEQLSQMNTNISSISTIVNAIDGDLLITSVEETTNGYSIHFNNGEVATLTNGKDGAAGKDAPVIGFGDFEGKYYWTQTIDGEQSWLTDEAGEKIPVTGADAVTPQLKVNTEGFWVISYDNGLTYTEMLDDAGNPVKAVGEDGKDGEDGVDGIDGSDGDDGDSWFSDIRVEDDKVVFVLQDGTEFSIPLEQELLDYVYFDNNLGEIVDYAILGLDGSGYFYEYQDVNPNVPKRVSIYDGNTEKLNLEVNFDEEGLPANILSEEFSIVLGNYENDAFDAVIITKSGESQILEDIALEGITMDEYLNGINSSMTRAASNSVLTWTNAIIGAVGCGLSIAAAPTGVGLALTVIGCTGAILDIANAAGWLETPTGSAEVNLIIGHYANIASCADIKNPVEVAGCFTGLIGNVTAIADYIFNANSDDVALGEGALVSGNGNIKITLTWDNYSDIDLHCVDPSGYHIYYANKVSTTGGFLDYDNVIGFGPENIYFDPAPEGAYHVYLHYFAENQGVNSVNYKVVIFNDGVGQTYEGTITGQGSYVDIATILFGTISNETRGVYYCPIDWNNLPIK